MKLLMDGVAFVYINLSGYRTMIVLDIHTTTHALHLEEGRDKLNMAAASVFVCLCVCELVCLCVLLNRH